MFYSALPKFQEVQKCANFSMEDQWRGLRLKPSCSVALLLSAGLVVVRCHCPVQDFELLEERLRVEDAMVQGSRRSGLRPCNHHADDG